MRKATRLGFCTTCNTKVYIFDTDGRAVRKRENYREAAVLLNDGSRGRAAFCTKCLKAGVDAEEAIANLIDGQTTDVEKKPWTPEFKEWYLSRYRPLKIMEVVGVYRCDPHKGTIPIEEEEASRVQPFRKLYRGEMITHPATKPPERFANVRPS